MAGPPRYAIYFVPGDDSALGLFGARVLGRWPDGRVESVPPGAPPCRAMRVARPRRYGFHATFKAPFALAAGAREDDLGAALERFAGAHAAAPLGPTVLDHAGGATALTCRDPVPGVDALANAAVVAFEPFRAPLDAAARARRRPASLDRAARARLERWGYPWVCDGFAFHMTLGAGPAAAAPADDAAWLEWLRAVRASSALDADAPAPVVDRLALCVQPDPDHDFVRRLDVALTGRDRPSEPATGHPDR